MDHYTEKQIIAARITEVKASVQYHKAATDTLKLELEALTNYYHSIPWEHTPQQLELEDQITQQGDQNDRHKETHS